MDVRDGALAPVVSCWPVKAVGAKNASGEKNVRKERTIHRRVALAHVLMKKIKCKKRGCTCVDSPLPHKCSKTQQVSLFERTHKEPKRICRQ